MLSLRHSGPSLFGGANATSQYGDPDVAATAIFRRRFVCSAEALRRVSPPSLPLLAPGAKQPPTATSAGRQSRLHRQSASAVNPANESLLPPSGPADQPRGGQSVAALAGRTTHPWLKKRPELLCDASYTTARIVMPQKSWLRSTIFWRL